MSDTVFANGMAIACKVSSGKTIAAMPDVCLSPPSPPAGPIPIPYPNTAMASDTDQGSKTVQIGGQPTMLKDKSIFKTSSGNEAATKSFGMSVVTHQIQGKASFIAWSMDVKIEGENVPRHLDLMGLNEASAPPSPLPQVHTSSMTPPESIDCTDILKRYPVESHSVQSKKSGGVYQGKQAHHVIQNAHFQAPRGTTIPAICPGYTEGSAPCIPLEDGTDPLTEHGAVSILQRKSEQKYRDSGKNPTYPEARQDAKDQLMAKPGPGMSDGEAECVLKEVDRKMEDICPGISGKQLRTPHQVRPFTPNPTSGSAVGGLL